MATNSSSSSNSKGRTLIRKLVVLYHLQLTIEEAFRLCRYDWMRDALRRFLAAVSEEMENDRREKLVELPRRLVSEAVAEPQMSSSAAGWFGKHSGVEHQHLGNLSTKCVVQGWSVPCYLFTFGVKDYHLSANQVCTVRQSNQLWWTSVILFNLVLFGMYEKITILMGTHAPAWVKVDWDKFIRCKNLKSWLLCYDLPGR